MPAGYFPIIYVRGYAHWQFEIEATVDDPFYGFNLGSTHIRSGPERTPQQLMFESPLVRLMTDHKYRDAYENGSLPIQTDSIARNPRSIWIYRFYDQVSEISGWEAKGRLTMEEAAYKLGNFIDQVKRNTGATKVHLVAHSMGGLICRCLLEKIYPDMGYKGQDHVARLFTYATPHGGINPDNDEFPTPGDFLPDRMYAYLTPQTMISNAGVPANFDSRHSNNAIFPLQDIFCLIGTNSRDYEPIRGITRWDKGILNWWSRKLVGPNSDGLVQIDDAFVIGASTAYVHRSHSGRYGIVNSEEGYLHLENFLFGDIHARVFFDQGATPVTRGGPIDPETSKNQFPKQNWDGDSAVHADVKVSLVGRPFFVDNRTRSHLCPVALRTGRETYSRIAGRMEFASLAFDPNKRDPRNRLFSIDLAIHILPLRLGKIDDQQILHEVPAWRDCLLGSICFNKKLFLNWKWMTYGEQIDKEIIVENSADYSMFRIPLPESFRNRFKRPNAEIQIQCAVSDTDHLGAMPPSIDPIDGPPGDIFEIFSMIMTALKNPNSGATRA